MIKLLSFILGVISILYSPFTFAQNIDFPNRTVKIVVPNPPGGPNDVIARMVAQKLSEIWQQAVVIENKVGAGGNIGTSLVAKSKPDGFTLLIHTSSIVPNMLITDNSGYNLEKELKGISNIGISPNIIVVSKSSRIQSIQDLINMPDNQKINYGSPGLGTTAHLSMESLFKILHKKGAEHIPYKGAAPAITALVGGELDMISTNIPPTIPYVKSGKMNAIGVTGSKRYFALPDVPTLKEQGLNDMDLYTWIGLFIPALTPEVIQKKIRQDMDKILSDKDFLDKLRLQGFETENESLQEFEGTIKKEILYWKRIIQILQ